MGSDDDESAPDTAPLLRWLESLGIPTAAAEKTVKQLVADGYSTVIEVKRLARAGGSQAVLMKFFSKLGHLDKVQAASADSELEEHIMREVVIPAGQHAGWGDVAGLEFAKATLKEVSFSSSKTEAKKLTHI